jgi:hypothetical protein
MTINTTNFNMNRPMDWTPAQKEAVTKAGITAAGVGFEMLNVAKQDETPDDLYIQSPNVMVLNDKQQSYLLRGQDGHINYLNSLRHRGDGNADCFNYAKGDGAATFSIGIMNTTDVKLLNSVTYQVADNGEASVVDYVAE